MVSFSRHGYLVGVWEVTGMASIRYEMERLVLSYQNETMKLISPVRGGRAGFS